MTQETFKQRQERGLRPPAVVISDSQEFAAINSGKRRTEQGPVGGEAEGLTGHEAPAGIVTHNRVGVVTMYKPDGHGHWTPRSVPATSISQNLVNGWHAHCPECGGDHGSDPNACLARPRTALRICPVCGQPIYDGLAYEAQRGDLDDPNVIHDEHDVESTPEARTLVARNLHMWMRHPQEARELNLPALANPPDVVTESVGG